MKIDKIGTSAVVIILVILLCSLILLCTLIQSINHFSTTHLTEDHRTATGGGSFQDLLLENDIKSSEYGSSLRFVSRLEWLAMPPNSDLNNLELPSQRIIIAHTATENCTNQATCTFRVRYIQTFHMESQGWDDIGYNFLVGGDGAVYEGRGWDKEGGHTKGFNKRSICIAFIGTFNKMVPPKRQLIAAQMLIDRGVKLNKLKPDYQLYGHRQLIPSESPGLALYDIIKIWPHWTETYIP